MEKKDVYSEKLNQIGEMVADLYSQMPVADHSRIFTLIKSATINYLRIIAEQQGNMAIEHEKHSRLHVRIAEEFENNNTI